jgi:hypothetical protein
MKNKGIKAWLVTWEHIGDNAGPKNSIALILNPRFSPEKVKEIIELLYIYSNSSIQEKMAYSKNASANPYKAEFCAISGHINCGKNPSLFGRKVTDLKISDEGTISFKIYTPTSK